MRQTRDEMREIMFMAKAASPCLRAVIKDMGPSAMLVRADTLPLVINVLGVQNLPRGARVRIKLGRIDHITLDIHGTVLARLDDPADPNDDAPLDDVDPSVCRKATHGRTTSSVTAK